MTSPESQRAAERIACKYDLPPSVETVIAEIIDEAFAQRLKPVEPKGMKSECLSIQEIQARYLIFQAENSNTWELKLQGFWKSIQQDAFEAGRRSVNDVLHQIAQYCEGDIMCNAKDIMNIRWIVANAIGYKKEVMPVNPTPTHELTSPEISQEKVGASQFRNDPNLVKDLEQFQAQLGVANEKLQRLYGENVELRDRMNRMAANEEANLESDSIVAACGCGEKTNDIRHHSRGCKYRLIVERNILNEVRLAALNMVGLHVGSIPQVEIDAGRIQHSFVLSAHRILSTGQPDGKPLAQGSDQATPEPGDDSVPLDYAARRKA